MGRSSKFFILGAGFTKAVFPDAPLNDDFLTRVVGSQPNDSPLGRLWTKYRTTDIERLLTQFDLDLGAEDYFRSAERNAVSEQIARFVEAFRFERDIPWLQPLLEILGYGDVILSLNYDCFLEGFLDFHSVWSPRGGYDLIQNPNDDSLPPNEREIRILKIHGAESFRLSPFADRPESVFVGVEIHSELFPRSGENRHFGGGIGSRPFLIAPSFAKQFVLELHYLMLRAVRSARLAKDLVIIGCGLRPEDGHLWQIITSFMNNPRWERKRTIIVDPIASQLKERISRFWGRDIFTETTLVSIDSGLEAALPGLAALLRG